MAIRGPQRVSGLSNTSLSNGITNTVRASFSNSIKPQKPGAVRLRILNLAKPLLTSNYSRTVRYAAKAIGQLGDPAALDALIPLLNSNNSRIICDAAKAIGQLGNIPTALNALTPLLNSNNSRIICDAAKAIGQLGNIPTALDALTPLLTSDNHFTVRYAAKTIGQLGDPAALDALTPLLTSDNHFTVCDAAEAIGQLGDPAALDTLIPLLTSNNSRIICDAAKAIGQLGDIPTALDALIPLLNSKNSRIICDAAKAIGQLGDIPTALNALIPLLNSKNHLTVCKAGEAIGQLGNIPTALNALIPLLNSDNHFTVCKAVEAICRFGDIRGLDILESSQLDKDIMSKALFIFVENYKPETPPSPLNPILQQAARIRAICKQYYRPQQQQLAKGYGNRGIRPGRRLASAGSDFQDLAVLHHAQSGGKRVDWKATERLGDSGDIAVKNYRTEEANKIMIVIDPRLFRKKTHQEKISILAGTLAQMALQRRDLAGLIIGEQKVYLKPSQNKDQLEAILNQIMAFSEVEETDLFQLLEQPILKKNLPAGAEVLLISNFEDVEAEQLDVIRARFSNVNVNFTPVAIDQKIAMPHPVMQIGRFRYRMHPQAAEAMADIEAKRKANKMNNYFATHDGQIIDIEKGDNDAIAIRAIEQAAGKTEIQFEPKGKLVGEKNHDMTTPEPENIAEIINQTDKWDILLFFANLMGWPTVSEYINAKIDELLNQQKIFNASHANQLKRLREELTAPENPDFKKYYDPKHPDYKKDEMIPIATWSLSHYVTVLTAIADGFASVDKASKNLISYLLKDLDMHTADPTKGLYQNSLSSSLVTPSEVAPSLPRLLIQGYGPNPHLFRNLSFDALQTIDQNKTSQPTQKRNGLFTRIADPFRATLHTIAEALRQPATAASPLISAVDHDDKKDKQTWQTLNPVPEGRHSYFRKVAGISFAPATASYEALEKLNNEAFAETGAIKIKGEIKFSSKEINLPSPVGGRIAQRKGKKVIYELADKNPGQVAEIMTMKFRDFRNKSSQIYGQELYNDSIQGVSLETIQKINPKIAAEWKALLNRIEHFTLSKAIAAIQDYLVNHPTLKYHRYESDVAKTLFKSLKGRMELGELEGHEYLELILKLGGGTCMEMATLGLTLLRLAGIPTALSSGFLADKKGNITEEGHAWAEVFIPYGENKWFGLPVEFSRVYAERLKASGMITIQKDPQKTEKEYPQAEKIDLTPTEKAAPSIDEFWLNTSPEKRAFIWYSFGQLLNIIEFRDKNWPETNLNTAELVFKSLKRVLINYQPSELTLKQVSTNLYPLPSERLSDIVDKHLDNNHGEIGQLVNRWSEIVSSVDPQIPRIHLPNK